MVPAGSAVYGTEPSLLDGLVCAIEGITTIDPEKVEKQRMYSSGKKKKNFSVTLAAHRAFSSPLIISNVTLCSFSNSVDPFAS